MKVAELALSGCVVALAIFVGVQARNLRRVTANDASLTTAVVSPGVVDSALASASAGSNPYERPVVSARTSIHVEAPLSPVELRRILDSASVGTYIRELLQSRDSTLARWPDHRTEPLRVWIAEPVQLNGWNERFPSSVRDAFDTWAETGVPLRFSYVYDSAGADVHVRFLPRFPTGISGKRFGRAIQRVGWWMETLCSH